MIDVFALEGADGDDGHLRAGFLLHLGAESFEAGGGGGSNDVGEIGDVGGGVDVLDFFGGNRERERRKKKNEEKLPREKARWTKKTSGRGNGHARTTIGGAWNPVKRGRKRGREGGFSRASRV